MYCSEIIKETKRPEGLLRDGIAIKTLRSQIDGGAVVIFENAVPADLIKAIRSYLFDIRKVSLERFSARREGVGNEFRVHNDRPEQSIHASFNSWSFYPWNADIFNFFSLFADLFALRNLIAGRDAGQYMSPPYNKLAARLAFQFYPSGIGYMDCHSDPLADHQVAIPTVLLSDPGTDFESGGFYVLDHNESRIMLDKQIGLGGMVLFNTQIPHGVALVDETSAYSPLSSSGRLMVITAVNSIDSEVRYESTAKTKSI